MAPLKYGVPGGMVFIGLFWLQIEMEWSALTLWRWLLSALMVIGAALWHCKKVEQAPSFRTLWFSGFSALAAGVITFSIIGYLLRELFFQSWTDMEVIAMVQVLFYEFINLSLMGLVVLTILSILLKSKPNGQP